MKSAISESPSSPPSHPNKQPLSERFHRVRDRTETLCETLRPEDFNLQPMADASPAKWHLAHTSWFFEAFVLPRLEEGYRPVREDVNFLYNSYYNALGDRIPRDRRGLMSRPTIDEVHDYRREVTRRVGRAMEGASERGWAEVAPVLEIGINHEEQHQELLLTDLKCAFALNPLRPAFRDREADRPADAPPMHWREYDPGVRAIGHDGDGFAFDNETPRHRVFLEAFAIASRPSTNREYLAFLDDGGYDRPEFWLSDGWAARKTEGWSSPMYWERVGQNWTTFTPGGTRPLVPSEPVVHLSFYEADAFARWSGARLPTEAEWEVAAGDAPIAGNLMEAGRYHPGTASESPFGDLWQWTAQPVCGLSRLSPGGRCVGGIQRQIHVQPDGPARRIVLTPADHLRASYRNFFRRRPAGNSRG